MVKIMENPIKMDDLVFFPLFWFSTHILLYVDMIHIYISFGHIISAETSEPVPSNNAKEWTSVPGTWQWLRFLSSASDDGGPDT